MRCFLPAGTQLALPKTHFNQTHAVPQALSSRDPWFHQKNVMNSPQDGGAPAEAAGSKARSCAGRRHKLRIRRFTLARHGHQRHMKWVTAAAATSRMAVMRPGFGLAAASLERNRPWLLSPAFIPLQILQAVAFPKMRSCRLCRYFSLYFSHSVWAF